MNRAYAKAKLFLLCKASLLLLTVYGLPEGSKC